MYICALFGCVTDFFSAVKNSINVLRQVKVNVWFILSYFNTFVHNTCFFLDVCLVLFFVSMEYLDHLHIVYSYHCFPSCTVLFN